MDKLQNELSELWYKISTEKKIRMENIRILQSQVAILERQIDEIEGLLNKNECHRVFAGWEENKPCEEAADDQINGN